ncbi:MAG: sigma-70 family RNA polymerase sigma factor [Bacteroidota bacterium]
MDTNSLVGACKKQDSKAQKELYERYSELLFRVCYRYVKNRFDVEDLVISSFMKIFKSISQFEYRDEKSLEGWMKRVVINESLMLLRKNNSFHMIAESGAEELSCDLSPISAMQEEDIYNLISELPTGYRTVFNLYVVEGYSHKEIAEKLEISENTSRTQLKKARNSLAEMIQKEGGKYGS